ncbi:hypothetical protein ACT3TP_02500 [Glutamicibacter sp. AOP38-B1-38]|uniref:hypothetical protein n=1 Tax=Glutamicibacter sp. AOP38-B1-38 TaxID=3457680 RepID=UPI004033A698
MSETADQPQAETSESAQATRLPRRWMLPAAIGGVAGCLIGALAVAGMSSPGLFAGGPDFAGAVEECEVSAEGFLVLDDGEALQLDSKGSDIWDSGTEDFAQIACVLAGLEVPGSVISKIDSTRALDGRQDDSWDGVAISWSYHPDSGVDILLEKER